MRGITDLMYQAHRKTLLDIMTSFIPLSNVKFSKRLLNIKQHSDKVTLGFADGEVAEASILAGTDGIKSTIRQHVLEPSHPTQVQPIYANAYCYRAVLPTSSANAILGSDLTDVAKFFFGKGRAVICYRISGGEVNSILTSIRNLQTFY
jgi:salicylate hydroxylase